MSWRPIVPVWMRVLEYLLKVELFEAWLLCMWAKWKKFHSQRLVCADQARRTKTKGIVLRLVPPLTRPIPIMDRWLQLPPTSHPPLLMLRRWLMIMYLLLVLVSNDRFELEDKTFFWIRLGNKILRGRRLKLSTTSYGIWDRIKQFWGMREMIWFSRGVRNPHAPSGFNYVITWF